MAEYERFDHLEALRQFSENVSPIDFILILEHWQLFLDGIWQTAVLIGLTLILSTAIAIPLAVFRARNVPVLSQVIWLYVYSIRGTPLLLQLYLIYYGFAEIEFIRESFMWVVFRDPWWCAIIAFTLNTTSYLVEIFRGAITHVPRGEVEAAKACGMSAWLQTTRIILPNALRRALPAYSNEVIFTIHGSVIASTVTIIDILGAGRVFNGKFYLAYEGFIVAAVLYMIVIYFVARGFDGWERNWFAHLRPREV